MSLRTFPAQESVHETTVKAWRRSISVAHDELLGAWTIDYSNGVQAAWGWLDLNWQ